MALRTSSAPTDPAHADKTFASAIFSSPELSLNTRANGTRASILSRLFQDPAIRCNNSTYSRATLTEMPNAKSQRPKVTQSSGAAVIDSPSPSTLPSEEISAATDHSPSQKASAKKSAGIIAKQPFFNALHVNFFNRLPSSCNCIYSS